MSRLSKSLCLLALLLTGARAVADDKAGEFDYYVMALSWAPSWCLIEGDARDAETCDPAADAGFTLHGLWPQYENGWPEYCRAGVRDPSRSQTAGMADLMGSGGAAWHQWKKHGRCSGLAADAYFSLAREAYDSVNRPEVLRRITKTLSVAPKVVEAAFLEENPALDADGITVTCRAGHILEARICLTKSLVFRTCGADVRRDCTAQSAQIPPVR